MRFTFARMIALAAVLLPLQARAQIVKLVDSRGRILYVNANPPSFPRLASRPASGRPSPLPARSSSVLAPPAPSSRPPKDLPAMIGAAARSSRLDPRLLRAVVRAESDGNPRAVSPKGAQGLMQLMPATALSLGVTDPFDPSQNLRAGTLYLRQLLDRYHGDLDKSLAAYNAGAQAVDRSRGVPNIPETRSYVRRITNSYFGSNSIPLTASPASHSRPIRRELDAQGRTVFTNE